MKFVTRLAQWLLEPSNRGRSTRHVQPGLVAYYWDGSVSLPHEIRDISSTGAYLSTTERWYPGTVIELTLRRNQAGTHQTGLAEFIIIRCKVVRHDSNGVGLRFIAPDSETRKVLKHFIRDAIASAKRKHG